MIKHSLEPSEKIDWLRLARTPRIGPVTFKELLRRFPSVRDALDALPELAHRGGSKTPFKPAPKSYIEDEYRKLEKLGGRFIAMCEPDYPAPLAAIDDAPPVIAVRGDIGLLHKDIIGIVGARNASLSGRKMAEKLATDLGEAGYVVASGLARGIDTAAHQKALTTGTIAVVAGGIDVVYPQENQKLYEQIADIGCIVSDQPMGLEPMAKLFPRRNRIISGLSLGIVVVEAAKRSGSLITARMALEQGREVFAVPGSPLDPRANGTNDLIRQGATLTEGAPDILEALSQPRRTLFEEESEAFIPAPIRIDESELPHVREKVIENLSTCPIDIDELVRTCQFSLPSILTVLLELELAGRLERHPGHKVSLIL
ncbi:MAG: DNA-processing protein DprA [Bdellovibrionales bacterium]